MPLLFQHKRPHPARGHEVHQRRSVRAPSFEPGVKPQPPASLAGPGKAAPRARGCWGSAGHRRGSRAESTGLCRATNVPGANQRSNISHPKALCCVKRAILRPAFGCNCTRMHACAQTNAAPSRLGRPHHSHKPLNGQRDSCIRLLLFCRIAASRLCARCIADSGTHQGLAQASPTHIGQIRPDPIVHVSGSSSPSSDHSFLEVDDVDGAAGAAFAALLAGPLPLPLP